MLESEFEVLLGTMQPSTETFELAKQMFEEAWERRSDESGAMSKRLKNRARQIDTEITSLLDRIVAAKNDSVVNSYEKRISDLESEKTLVEENAIKCCAPERSFEEVFELAMNFLSSPWKVWKKEDIILQKTVLRLVFAHPLAFCRKTGLRTPETTFPFKVLSFLTASNCKLVRVKCTEVSAPNCPTLANFDLYYAYIAAYWTCALFQTAPMCSPVYYQNWGI